ncbi:MAG TPA: hypothetical protein VF794_06055 [Archangium sp.]|uniref:hypothetical protein n=1 Tax=Archangium sp. TaxID=1872627 RepID=UPI002ED7E649
MPTPRPLLCAALTFSLLLTSGTAEARFGKRSNSDSSSEEKEEKKERRHEATPVDSSGDDDSDSGSDSHSGSSYSGGSHGVVVVSDDTPTYPYAYRPSVEQRAEPRERGPLMVRLGLEGQSMGGGSALAVNLGLEGKRWGVGGARTALTLPTDDGTEGSDQIQLYTGHLTYALYSSDQGRLRAEAGFAVAYAPDVTFVGPSLGMSFERCLFGGLDLEGRAQVVPVPYAQLDAQAGLGLHLGLLTLRGGWRWLLLNDRGLVDGETHEDVFAGPYAGIGLAF